MYCVALEGTVEVKVKFKNSSSHCDIYIVRMLRNLLVSMYMY